jgi:hypothetical protein
MIELAADEVIAERPFTATPEGERDLEMMNRMLLRLRRHIGGIGLDAPSNARFGDEGEHMIILPHPELICLPSTLAAVGFFGQARADVDHQPIIDLEHQLIDDMTNNPGLVAYYNVHWPGEGWGNLVLFVDFEAKDGWGHDDRHRRAVERSPDHYHSIRLHNGVLPGGLRGPNGIRLIATKYLDFEAGMQWRAIRRYEG